MKVQDVLLKAMAKKITWWAAAEIIGVTDRTMRRWRERYEERGYDGLYDHLKRQPSRVNAVCSPFTPQAFCTSYLRTRRGAPSGQQCL